MGRGTTRTPPSESWQSIRGKLTAQQAKDNNATKASVQEERKEEDQRQQGKATAD